ncbi:MULTISPECIES: alpha/beta fold hydrolase [Ferrimonas]|uniref:alpha/beta fold hydrolase n=1 Tax=Ferrimonas TaxID=44011 RepID=UPI0004297E8B|nr:MULTISPECIES: alpha/beta fold hydrolase [Ferrimonas]USD36304.1 alpha/beta fold hydrolase [Ferrimonas sp. SCSIO 43195]
MLNFIDQGHGPAVVLIHGLFGNADNLGRLGAALLAEHWRVIRIDLPNHGRSVMGYPMSLANMAEALEQLRRQLSLDRWALVGHSLGGKVAMTYAQAHPQQVSALVVADIAPVGYQTQRHQAVLATLTELNQQPQLTRKSAQQHFNQAGIDSGTSAFLLKNLRPDSDGDYHWQLDINTIVHHYPDIIGPLPEQPPYSGPVLFVKGERSDYLLPEHRPEIGRRFPQAKARIITGTGHWLHAEKPDQFNRHVAQFLAPYQG